MAIHGGASEVTTLLKNNTPAYEKALKTAVETGYRILEANGRAVDAVEAAVMFLEDDPLFNAGRGSVLNKDGQIEMDAAIMDGHTLNAGAVAMVRHIKNPISLARKIMEESHHILLCGYGAEELARYFKLKEEGEDYFITDYQHQVFLKLQAKESMQDILKKSIKGTVGAVALDQHGHVAAATSTGGTANCFPGRVGDSCLIGAGCYAHNNTCAVSGTGEGEALMTGVVAHTIAMLVELKGWPLQQACDFVIHQRNTQQREIGVIAVNTQGVISMSYNTEIMKRAWMSSDEPLQVKIY